MIIRVSCFRLTHHESSNFKNRLWSCFFTSLTVVLPQVKNPRTENQYRSELKQFLVQFWWFSSVKIDFERIFDYFQLYLDFKSKSFVPLKNFWSFRLFRNNSLIWLAVSTPVLIRHYDNLMPSVILSRNWKKLGHCLGNYWVTWQQSHVREILIDSLKPIFFIFHNLWSLSDCRESVSQNSTNVFTVTIH